MNLKIDNFWLAYQNMLGGFCCPPMTIWNPEDAERLVLRNDLLTSPVIPAIFFLTETLMTHSISEFVDPSPGLCQYLPAPSEAPLPASLSWKAEPQTLDPRHHIPLVKTVALSLAHVSLKHLSLLLFLQILLSFFAISTCMIRVKQETTGASQL